MAPDDVPGLSDLDPHAPVYMVNLLKFKKPDGLKSYLEPVERMSVSIADFAAG